MTRISITVVIAALALGSLAFADTLTFDTPANTNLGVSHTYSQLIRLGLGTTSFSRPGPTSFSSTWQT
jgi:hypothetical protein